MSVKIAFLLFCAAVITECESQQGASNLGFFAFPGFHPNNDYISFPAPNKIRERIPSNAQNGFVSNQGHFGSSDRKGTTKPETQSFESINQKIDDSEKQTDQQIIRKKPVQSSINIDQPEYYSTHQEAIGSKRPTEILNRNPDPYSTQFGDNQNNDRRQQASNKGQNPEYTTLGSRPNYNGQNRPNGPSSQSNNYHPESVSLIQPAQPIYIPSSVLKKPVSKNPYGQNDNEGKFEDYKPITQFSWNLFKRVINPQQPNIVICPLSPQHILSYLAGGAAGETRDEIVRAIGYKTPAQLNTLLSTMLKEPGNKELQLASAFFVAERIGLNSDFQNSLADNTKIIKTDFSNTEKFNREYSKWVAEKTKGVLANVRVKPEPSTRMLMSSAVYFKGEWIFKLNPGGIDDFYVTENNPVKVPMMKLLKKLPYGKLQNGNLGEWISLPYNSNDSMVIILPRKGLSLDELVQKLNIQEVFDSMNIDNYGNVTLTLPKFKVESRSSLINPLQQMGIRQLFSTNAQLPLIFNTNEPLTISNVLQQASLEVNEEGSIATSLTSFAVVALSFSPPTPDVEFKVDRPFISMIIDRKNNFPYFIAKISNPAV